MMNENLYNACDNKIESGKSWGEIAKEFDYGNPEKLRGAFRRAKLNNNSSNGSNVNKVEKEVKENDNSVYRESEEIKQDGSIISDRLIKIREMDSKNPKNLLEAHGFDPEKWTLINCKNNFWNGMRPKDLGLLTLYQSKIVVKPKEENSLSISQLENFLETFVPIDYNKSYQPKQYDKNGITLEIDLADVHVGNESLSFDKLKERVIRLIYEIKSKTKGLSIKNIYLVQLGDILHFDNYARQTTSGTQVTYGSNFYKMFEYAMSLMIWVIEELSKISRVEVINIYGNHDKINSYTLAKTIEAYFRNNENIVIDASVDIRKFRKIGVSSVAFIHGDIPKANISATFQKEARKLFGDTFYTELHCGHLHHEISLEKDGVIIRYVPSMTIPDEWHKSQGYTGAKQGTHCFVWDDDKGLTDIWMIAA